MNIQRNSMKLATLVLGSMLLASSAFAAGVGDGRDYTDSLNRHPLGIAQAGTTGVDFSANKPTVPNVGAAFAASGPYASYVLVATVPARLTRFAIDVENTSGAQIAIVIDDGTVASGSAPTNATIIPLAGGTAAGSQGGSWVSYQEKGRIQVYAPSSSAQVAVRQN